MISRPTTNFCRLPPGQRAGLRVGLALAHVEGLGDASAALARPRRESTSPCRTSAAGRVARTGRTFSRQASCAGAAAWPLPLLRHEGRAAPAPRVDAVAADRRAVDARRRRRVRRGALARHGGEEFGLAVAGHARDADDLAAADRKRDVASARCRAARGCGSDRSIEREAHRAEPVRGRGAAPPRPRCRPSGCARRAHALLARIAGRRRPCRARRMVARWHSRFTSSSRWRDVERPHALGRELLQRHEEVVGLLRRQHRGRLVEDEQLRLLQQAADDLDALPLAGRERPDRPVGIERQAIARRDLGDAAPRAPSAPRPVGRASAMFSATVSLSNSEKCWNTMPMPSRARRRRAGDGDRLALPADFARVRLQHAVEDLDQRRLAGAVLAEQRMDLPGPDVQVPEMAQSGAARRRPRVAHLGGMGRNSTPSGSGRRSRRRERSPKSRTGSGGRRRAGGGKGRAPLPVPCSDRMSVTDNPPGPLRARGNARRGGTTSLPSFSPFRLAEFPPLPRVRRHHFRTAPCHRPVIRPGRHVPPAGPAMLLSFCRPRRPGPRKPRDEMPCRSRGRSRWGR